MEIVYVSPSEIEIGDDRLRKDLGDTEDLERSIRKFGLLQPIAVTEKRRLVWGWRRLETWKKVKGEEPIPARIIPEKYARLAELIENVCREDVPWHLKDMAMAEYHKKLEQEAVKSDKQETEESEKEESPIEEARDFSSDADEKSIGRGRPPKPWTHEDTAEALGISRSKVTTALNLVQTMEKYPEIKNAVTEREALRMLQKLKGKEKAPEREEEKTWKCEACGKEYGELDPVAPTKVTLCPDCLIDFGTWKVEKFYDEPYES